MRKFKGVKWRIDGISGRMIKTNQYSGFVADVDSKENAMLIAKAPEMLDMLETMIQDYEKVMPKCPARDVRIDKIKKLIKSATEG